jgi:DNA-binding PadR family transcriptional regulator
LFYWLANTKIVKFKYFDASTGSSRTYCEKGVKRLKTADREAQILEFRGFLSFLILHELKQKSQSGDELAVKIGKRKGATLTPGTIYPTLKRLHHLKLVFFRRNGRKKMYLLTDLGNIELEKQYVLFSKYFYGFKGVIQRPKKQKQKQKQNKQKRQDPDQKQVPKQPDEPEQVQENSVNVGGDLPSEPLLQKKKSQKTKESASKTAIPAAKAVEPKSVPSQAPGQKRASKLESALLGEGSEERATSNSEAPPKKD